MLSESEIGKNIRRIRKAKSRTQGFISQKTGFTKGYLSKVENSEKAPPVSTLINIAAALNVSVSEILGEQLAEASVSVVRKKERRLMARDGSAFGYAYETLVHKFRHKRMEPYILTVPRESEQHHWFQHEGEEILLVQQGTFKFILGESEYELEEGDCIYFDSGSPHRGYSIGPGDVKCLIVICSP